MSDTPASDARRLSHRTSYFYSFGQAAEGIKNDAFTVFLLPYYTLIVGLPPALTGLALSIALAFDAVSDPLAGWISDHLHTRWKRRHPFLYLSALPLSVSYILLWMPPPSLVAEAQNGAAQGLPTLFWWLLGGAIAVRLSMTLFHVPHLSLAAELTQDYDQRTRLTGLRVTFSWLGGLTSSLIAWSLFFRSTDEYPSGVLNPAGYADLAIFGSITMLVIILISSIGTHDQIPHLHAPSKKQTNPLMLLRDIGRALNNRSVLALVLAAGFGVLAFRLTQAMGVLVYTYFWELTSEQVRLFVLMLFASAICANLLAQRTSLLLDKKWAFFCCGIVFAFTLPALVTLRFLGILPDNGATGLFVIVACFTFVNAVLGVAITVLQNAMMADVTDDYELRYGERREGLFFSMNALIAKGGAVAGVIIAGFALELVGIERGVRPGEVGEQSLFWLGMFEGPLSGIFKVAAICSILLYSLNRARHGAILRELARRKAAPPA